MRVWRDVYYRLALQRHVRRLGNRRYKGFSPRCGLTRRISSPQGRIGSWLVRTSTPIAPVDARAGEAVPSCVFTLQRKPRGSAWYKATTTSGGDSLKDQGASLLPSPALSASASYELLVLLGSGIAKLLFVALLENYTSCRHQLDEVFAGEPTTKRQSGSWLAKSREPGAFQSA